MRTVHFQRVKEHSNPPGTEDKIREGIGILLVNDGLVRQGLRHALETAEGLEVVGECNNAGEALSQVKTLSPEVVLMGLQMPGIDGIEATRRLKEEGPDCDVDIIILAECVDRLVEALEAGVAGYFLQDMRRDQLAEGIRQVYRNENLLGERDGFVEEVDLVVSLPAGAAQLSRFTGQVEKALRARVMETVGSSDWGTTITVLLKPTLLANVIDKLGNICDVEKVEEEPPARGRFPSILDRFRALSRSRANLRRRILIALKETDMADQGLVAALN